MRQEAERAAWGGRAHLARLGLALRADRVGALALDKGSLVVKRAEPRRLLVKDHLVTEESADVARVPTAVLDLHVVEHLLVAVLQHQAEVRGVVALLSGRLELGLLGLHAEGLRPGHAGQVESSVLVTLGGSIRVVVDADPLSAGLEERVLVL